MIPICCEIHYFTWVLKWSLLIVRGGIGTYGWEFCVALYVAIVRWCGRRVSGFTASLYYWEMLSASLDLGTELT